ncbi:VOC family protein [Lujinxingia vulgaris]|uniref:VOC family protein n=1 Tax=Lujinxingia vulgaris TaxID=2600176 RepID=A0A5C6XMH6_9DELT|nr:VOC family protein [Lujinxingia vulgaris]TXD39425.1 VOC family protein [Lujinxingia vulgaris]
MSRGLHHIALGARQVEEVARFYREAFGLRELTRHAYEDGALRSIWLDLNPGVLMVEHSREERPRVEGVEAGPFLLAFAMEAEERASMRGRLEAMGCEVEEESAFTLYARDPEGNRVAVSHYPCPAPPG